jgi:hypothetical protein
MTGMTLPIPDVLGALLPCTSACTVLSKPASLFLASAARAAKPTRESAACLGLFETEFDTQA